MSSRFALRSAIARCAALCLLCAAALQGCAPTAPRDDGAAADAAHAERAQRALALDRWTARGRLTVRVLADLAQDESRDRGIAAQMRWRQEGDSYRITLSNSLGQGLMQLAGGPGAVALRTAEGDRYEAEDAETLLRRQVGWSVPLGGMRYWVLGIAYPGVAPVSQEIDSQGRLRVLEQSGWRVDFLEYRRAGDGQELPARISMSSARVRASVAVSRWQL